jgi:hypothetical protein
MARRETSLSCKLACVIGMRHTLMLPGIDADMREFGQDGIKHGERELLETRGAGITGRERPGDRNACDHAEIARRLAGPRNGVVAAMDFVEGRDTGAEAITV